jgi:hypothetical protein
MDSGGKEYFDEEVRDLSAQKLFSFKIGPSIVRM